MNSIPLPASYIDFRNQKLWDELNQQSEIIIEYHSESTYGVYQINQQITVYVPEGEPCIASFTHELLHLWLTQNDFSPSPSINSILKSDKLTLTLLGSELIEHITNCVEHVKMLPRYLEMGFLRSKFIDDFNVCKSSPGEMQRIENWFKSDDTVTRCIAVRGYIGAYFGMQACPNSEFDYTSSFFRLKVIDPTLFRILDNFWQSWSLFNVENSDSVLNSHRLFSFPFTQDLRTWLQEKFI